MTLTRKAFSLALVVMLALVAFALARPAGAASVTPIFVPGNPDCEDLGYAHGFKPQPEPPPTGTYTIPGTSETVTITSDGTYFDWTSTLGMDAVIAKGGPNANLYVYDPPSESFGDSGLSAPINNDSPFGLSHIEFCYDFEVTVSKTANTSLTRTYSWTIDKSVTPDEWNLFTGDTGTSEYTVAVTKSAVESDWKVQGEITIFNPDPTYAATITSVADVITPGNINATVDCDGKTSVPAGGSITCTYSANLPNGDTRTNTATVATSGEVGGGTGTADVNFSTATVTEAGYPSINVDDTNGSTWQFNDSGSQTYTRTFSCDGEEGTHNNTATIRETSQSDSASVKINCYELSVTKTADTSLTRTYDWTIQKTGNQATVVLSTGQSFTVNYTVVVDVSGSTESEWAVSGDIIISNPNPSRAAQLTTVADIVSPNIAATVDCDGETSVPAGDSIKCTYSASLPNTDSRTNTATASLQNYDYDKDGNGTASGTTDSSGSASVDFDSAKVTEVDECIDVTDDRYGALGTVCAGEAPKTFEYSLTVGPYETCGEYTFVNIASFTTNDTGATGSDDHTVNVDVPCAGGCTLTQGYWKTHSKYGPAPYDDTWAGLAGFNEDTTFFLSGKSYYNVLWTPPAGNVYYTLAHQYIAAKLNVANGASTTTAVDTALATAKSLFETKTPAQAAALKGSAKNTWTTLASTLDKYNNGLIGPGHCSE